MTDELTDTSPAVAILYRELLLARSGEERVRMACEMFDAARRLVLASLPAAVRADPVKCRVHLLRRFYGRDLDERVLAGVIAQLRERSAQCDAG